MMEHGPEFEYTEDELHEIAEMLIKGEKDPFKNIHKRDQKNSIE